MVGIFSIHNSNVYMNFLAFDKNDFDVCISLAFLPPNLTNMNKITYRQAAIDSSMPGEFKKCN